MKINLDDYVKSRISKSRYFTTVFENGFELQIRISDHNKCFNGWQHWQQSNECYTLMSINGIEFKMDNDFFYHNGFDSLGMVFTSNKPVTDFLKIKKDLRKLITDKMAENKMYLTYEKD